MLRKKKVDFATGARTLRGGKNHYTPKTFCGNWVEGQTDPSYKTLAEQTKYDKNWESIAKIDMKNGVGVKIRRYGEGMNAYVKYPDHWLDYGDERYESKNWQGLTQSQFTGGETKTEFSSTTTMKPNEYMTNESYAENYRKRWTLEGEALVERRFSTTNGRSTTYHPEKFQVKQLRPLKGAPNAVGKLLASIIKRGGVLSWQKLRRELQKVDVRNEGVVDVDQLRDGLVEYFGGIVPVSGAPIRPEDVMGLVLGEFKGICAFMDKNKNGLFNIEEFIYSIQGEMGDSRQKCVNEVFNSLTQGNNVITSNDINSRYKGDESNEWKDMIRNASGITSAGFSGFYRGISSAITDNVDFENKVRGDWIAPNQRILPAFVQIRKVKVLHKDGRETIEEIDWDPAMGSNGQAMKSSLLARGMSVDTVTLIKE
jgi:hypothetical protein